MQDLLGLLNLFIDFDMLWNFDFLSCCYFPLDYVVYPTMLFLRFYAIVLATTVLCNMGSGSGNV